MQVLPSRSGSICNSNLFDAIELAPNVAQNGWNDKSAVIEEYNATIETANKAINLIEYLQTKMILEEIPSNSNWSYKTKCVFHKSGSERTASMFINVEQNRYYCHACSASGGIVEYIAKIYKRSPFLVAQHILNCIQGNYQIDTENIKKANDRKKFQINFIKISDLYRSFAKKYVDDDAAMIYINKCFAGFDSIIEDNQEKIEQSIEQIVKHFENYLKKYEDR